MAGLRKMTFEKFLGLFPRDYLIASQPGTGPTSRRACYWQNASNVSHFSVTIIVTSSTVLSFRARTVKHSELQNAKRPSIFTNNLSSNHNSKNYNSTKSLQVLVHRIHTKPFKKISTQQHKRNILRCKLFSWLPSPRRCCKHRMVQLRLIAR